MSLARPVFFLFALNLADAFLTLYWVRAGIAPESNAFMASLLDMGDLPFLGFKIAMGLFTAGVLAYGSEFKLAHYGLKLVIALYIGTMGVHVFTGLAGFGYL